MKEKSITNAGRCDASYNIASPTVVRAHKKYYINKVLQTKFYYTNGGIVGETLKGGTIDKIRWKWLEKCWGNVSEIYYNYFISFLHIRRRISTEMKFRNSLDHFRLNICLLIYRLRLRWFHSIHSRLMNIRSPWRTVWSMDIYRILEPCTITCSALDHRIIWWYGSNAPILTVTITKCFFTGDVRLSSSLVSLWLGLFRDQNEDANDISSWGCSNSGQEYCRAVHERRYMEHIRAPIWSSWGTRVVLIESERNLQLYSHPFYHWQIWQSSAILSCREWKWLDL